MADLPQTSDPATTESPQPGPTTAIERFWHSHPLRRLRREWKPIAAAVVLTLSVKSGIMDWYSVQSGSMMPSILPGDRVGVNKLAYGLRVPFTLWRLAAWDGPARGDVVLLLSPLDGTRLIKRVVAVPGDTLAMRKNRLYINGQAVEYQPDSPFSPLEGFEVLTEKLTGRSHPVMTHLTTPSQWSELQSTTLPTEHYMVMGDNRDLSADSRVFGMVPRRLILGRASRVILSLDRRNWWLPRWDRFLETLP